MVHTWFHSLGFALGIDKEIDMLKLFIIFLLDRGIERIEARYKSDYDKLAHDVKIKEADDEQRDG